MGEWRRPRTFKFSEEESAMLLAIHDSLAPMHENESQTVRWVIRMMHMQIFTPGMLPKFAALLQGIPRTKVYDAPVAVRTPRRKAQEIAR